MTTIAYDAGTITMIDQTRLPADEVYLEISDVADLVAVILAGIRHAHHAVPWLVGLYITAAYWFTASTSFANPAVTFARALTDTFSGIRPEDAGAFIAAQLLAAVLALLLCRWLVRADTPE